MWRAQPWPHHHAALGNRRVAAWSFGPLQAVPLRTSNCSVVPMKVTFSFGEDARAAASCLCKHASGAVVGQRKYTVACRCWCACAE